MNPLAFPVVAIIIWSTHAVVGKNLIEDEFLWSLPAIRFFVAWAGISLFLFVIKSRGVKLRATPAANGVFYGALFLGLVPNIFFFHGALYFGTAGSTMVLENTAPVFALILSYFIFKGRFGYTTYWALFFVATGVFVIYFYKTNGFLTEPLDVLFGLGAGLSWGAYMCFTEKLTGHKKDYGWLGVQWVQKLMFWAGIVTLPGLLVDFPQFDFVGWSLLFYYSLGPTALAFVLWNEALKTYAAIPLSIGFSLSIPLTYFVAFAFLGERPGLLETLGAISILMGVIINVFKKQKHVSGQPSITQQNRVEPAVLNTYSRKWLGDDFS